MSDRALVALFWFAAALLTVSLVMFVIFLATLTATLLT